LERRLIKNDELEVNIWKEIPELDDILKLNKLQLKNVHHVKIKDIKNQMSNAKYLIKEGAHYYGSKI
jgi:hypothetical protein